MKIIYILIFISTLFMNAYSAVIGNIDSVKISDINKDLIIHGWSCEQSKNVSTSVHLYVGGDAGIGTFAGTSIASLSSENAVSRACGTSQVPHRFKYQFNYNQYSDYIGQKIYIYGSSKSQQQKVLLESSGVFGIPIKLKNSEIKGVIDSSNYNSIKKELTIAGWACNSYKNHSINVHLYLGGAAGKGKFYSNLTANIASDKAVNKACKTDSTNHRFKFILKDYELIKNMNKSIYIHGISTTSKANLLLTHSGKYRTPKRTLNLSEIIKGPYQDLIIPEGQDVEIDTSIDVRHLKIQGNLSCKTNSKEYYITAQAISVSGNFKCGSKKQPFAGKLHMRLKEGYELDGHHKAMGERSFIVLNGGEVSFYGKTENSQLNTITKTVHPGDNYIDLKLKSTWSIGDEIVLTPSGFNMNEAERLIIKSFSKNNKRIHLNSNLEFQHYGELQPYKINDYDLNLDERSKVVNLNRNIKIYSYLGDYSNTKLGAHFMVKKGAKVYIDAVEFSEMGRQGEMGRYPFHWHKLGNAKGQFIKNSSIHDSYQRCITIHDTNYTQVVNNVCYNHFGHGYFLETGSEIKNTLINNIGFVSKLIPKEKSLLISDVIGVTARFPAPATFWISNPNNTINNNIAGGSDGTGFWMSFERKEACNKDACSKPYITKTLSFNGNIAHSSKVGMTWDGAPGDESTNNPNNPTDRKLTSIHYSPPEKPYYKNLVAYKNREAGIYFRGDAALFEYSMLADNRWSLFLAYSQHFKNSAIVGKSLNFSHADLLEYSKDTPYKLAGAVLYDGPMELENVAFLNFPTRNEKYLNKTITPIPIRIIGGANRFENKVKGLYFSPEPWKRVDFETQEGAYNWRDSAYSTSLRDLDGSLSGEKNNIIVPNHEFNEFHTCKTHIEWSAKICKYNLGLYSFQLSSGNGQVYFELTSPYGVNGIDDFLENRLYHNKFNTILESNGYYEVNPLEDFIDMESFYIILQTEKQRSGSLIQIKNKGNCTVSNLKKYTTFEQISFAEKGYYSDGINLFIKLKTSNKYHEHRNSELSDIYWSRHEVSCI